MNNDLYRAAGVPERHKSFRPEQSTSEEWTAVYNSLKERINDGILSAITGERGCGKTQLGACLIGHCAFNLQKSCMYQKSADIFLRIREGMKIEGDSEKAAIAEFVKPFLLVIDAFEVRSESQFENRMLDHIIDKRYDGQKSTIILSNDTVDNLRTVLGSSICDRMRETGGIIWMTWKSFRIQKNFK